MDYYDMPVVTKQAGLLPSQPEKVSQAAAPLK
jgi:hypothetical protein